MSSEHHQARPSMKSRNSNQSLSSIASHDLVKRVKARTEQRSGLLQSVWQFLEEPDSSRLAFWFSRLLPLIVVMSVVFSLAQSTPNPLLDGQAANILDMIFDVF